MENNYYKLLNFVTKLSQPKKTDFFLDAKSNLDESKGEYIIDIFENGIDNAEAIIAIEARKLLKSMEIMRNVEIVEMMNEVEDSEEAKENSPNEEQIIRQAFQATGGNVPKMVEMTKIPMRTLYKKINKFGMNKKIVQNEHIQFWMKKCKGNMNEVARKLDVSPKTVKNRLEAMKNLNSQPST